MSKPKGTAKLKAELRKDALRRAPKVQVTPQKLDRILKRAKGGKSN